MVRTQVARFRGLVAWVVGLTLVSAAPAWAQDVWVAGKVDPVAADNPVETVIVDPPSIVEDNEAVLARLYAEPVQEVWSYRPLLRDNAAPPELLGGLVHVLDELRGEEGGIADLGVGWEGYSGTAYPPDPTMAAGPSHVIACNNVNFRIYTKAGTQQYSSTWTSFFSGLASFTFCSDPKVLYDHDSGRWFLLILGLNNSYYSWYLLAVSDDSDPNGTWKKYAIDSTVNGGTSTNNMSDYPGLGVSSDALYITANMFNRFSWAYQYVKLRVFPKQQLLDFASTLTYSDLWSITDADGGLAFTIQPAQHWGTPQAPFLVDSDPSTKVNVFGVNNPLGTPSLTVRSATVTSFSAAPSAVQQGSSTRLDTIDDRVYNAVWRNNSVWFAHTTSYSSRAACRWYEVRTNNWPSSISVQQSGTHSGSNVYQWFPSVAVNQFGSMVLGYCRSGSAEYASIYYAYRHAGDAAGTLSSPLPIKVGTRAYTGEGGSVVRYGDYTGTVVDPADDTTFWHYNEYPNPTYSSRWSSWVQQIVIDTPTTRVVTVDSTPLTGATISVTPLDNYGNGDGTTLFSRTYDVGTTVTLTAPSTASSGLLGFVEWQLDGVPQTTSTMFTFDADENVTATAVYDYIYHLGVYGFPELGVPITVSPADRLGRTDGTTDFAREYIGMTTVTLTAPATFNARPFLRWEVNGAPQPDGQMAVDVDLDQLNEEAAAYYGDIPSGDTLSIGSLPLSGVDIQVSPLDNQGLGDGTTPFERLYPSSTVVTLTAPDWPVASGTQLNFWRWKVGGTPQPDDQLVLNHTMAGNATVAAEYVVAGDMNGDNLLNAGDIPGFVLALSDPGEYANQYPGLDGARRGDCNNDGAFNSGDIPFFVDLLTQ